MKDFDSLFAQLVATVRHGDNTCQQKAAKRNDWTFTLVGQDRSSPTVIAEWIKANIETAPPEKLFHALTVAILMRSKESRKVAD